MVVTARFKFAGTFREFDFRLRNKIRGFHIPPADDYRPQQLASAFFDKQDPGARWTEHPFLCAGTQKIDLFQGNRKCADGLNCVERKQDPAFGAYCADRFNIYSKSTDVMCAGERK